LQTENDALLKAMRESSEQRGALAACAHDCMPPNETDHCRGPERVLLEASSQDQFDASISAKVAPQEQLAAGQERLPGEMHPCASAEALPPSTADISPNFALLEESAGCPSNKSGLNLPLGVRHPADENTFPRHAAQATLGSCMVSPELRDNAPDGQEHAPCTIAPGQAAHLAGAAQELQHKLTSVVDIVSSVSSCFGPSDAASALLKDLQV
jgi:hypothetical protein